MEESKNTITFYHSIEGVDKPPTELEVDEEYIGEIFQYSGVDYRDKQKDEVIRIWKELDGLEYESECGWDEVSEMMDDDDFKYSRGYYKRLNNMDTLIKEKIDELIDKNDIETWKYHTWEDYEDGIPNWSWCE